MKKLFVAAAAVLFLGSAAFAQFNTNDVRPMKNQSLVMSDTTAPESSDTTAPAESTDTSGAATSTDTSGAATSADTTSAQ